MERIDSVISNLINNNLLTIKDIKGRVFFIDVLEMTKSIKQIIMLVHYYRNMNKDGLSISILITNKFYKTLLENFIKKNGLSNNIFLYSNINSIQDEKIVIVISDIGKTELESTIIRLVNKRKYLFIVATKYESIFKERNGMYSIQVDNNKLQALYFFITLISKSINNAINKQV
jgi:hypothetical protein